jgi:hypothetical protein
VENGRRLLHTRRRRRPAVPPTRPPPGLQRQRSKAVKASEAAEARGKGRASLVRRRCGELGLCGGRGGELGETGEGARARAAAS